MAERIRRTHEQRQAELERKLQRVKSERKKVEQARRTRRAVILGTTIEAMAEAGDLEAKLAMDKVLAGLTRNQDRKMFDLELLPEGDQPAAKPSVADLEDRVNLAATVWTNELKTAETKGNLTDAIIALETATGELYSGMKQPETRKSYNLGDRPGQRLRAS
jgi:hypothetical protein